MKNNEEFDKAFRDKLGTLSEAPPPEMWAAIEARLPGAMPVQKSNKRYWPGALALLILMSAGITLWVTMSDEPAVVAVTQPAGPVLQTEVETPVTVAGIPVTKANQWVKPEQLTPNPASNSLATIPHTNQSINPRNHDNHVTSSDQYEEVTILPLGNTPIGQPAIDESPFSTPEEIVSVEVPIAAIAESMTSAIQPDPDIVIADSTQNTLSSIDPPTTAKELKKLMLPKLFTGIYYQPELVIHKQNIPESTTWAQGGGLRLGLEYKSFLFESGLSVSASNDKWQYNLDYLSRDSVGWYWDVQFVNFIPLLNQHGDTIGYEPQYTTIPAAVYDSVGHQHTEWVEGRYTYYSIPVMLGITRPLHSLQGITCTLKGGLIYSRISGESTLSPAFSDPSVRITEIYDGRYFRQKSALQWVAALELRYSPYSKLAVFAEPAIRFYHSPYYYRTEGGELNNPVGLSLRAGLYYRF